MLDGTMWTHVLRVQKMYGKAGWGVVKAELGPAEEDPRFNICRDQFACHKSKTLRQFSSERSVSNRTWTPMMRTALDDKLTRSVRWWRRLQRGNHLYLYWSLSGNIAFVGLLQMGEKFANISFQPSKLIVISPPDIPHTVCNRDNRMLLYLYLQLCHIDNQQMRQNTSQATIAPRSIENPVYTVGEDLSNIMLHIYEFFLTLFG